jgi:hypothetical protein
LQLNKEQTISFIFYTGLYFKMKKTKTLLLGLIALIAFTSNAFGKNVMHPTYIFGFSASFNDSIVYFTNIQRIDSAWIGTKTTFLFGRDNYSYQLKNYLSSIGMNNRTCLVEFAKTKKDIDKKYQKLMKRYIPDKKKGQLPRFAIKHLSASDFEFKAMQPTANELEEEPAEKPKRKNRENRPEGHSRPNQRGEGGPFSSGGQQPPMGGMQQTPGGGDQ